MKNLVFFLISFVCSWGFAQQPGDLELYTPKVVVDNQSMGQKGAVRLLWRHVDKVGGYLLQLDNGQKVFSKKLSRHFFDVMVYFDKNYRWRVKPVSSQGFSPWRSLTVVQRRGLANFDESQSKESIPSKKTSDEFYLDSGE